jgi:hypothetical protein
VTEHELETQNCDASVSPGGGLAQALYNNRAAGTTSIPNIRTASCPLRLLRTRIARPPCSGGPIVGA